MKQLDHLLHHQQDLNFQLDHSNPSATYAICDVAIEADHEKEKKETED